MSTTKISDERRQDLLASATYAITYWAVIGDDFYDILDSVVKPNEKDCFEDRVWKALQAGKELPIRDVEDDEKILGYLSLKNIEEGEQLMAEKYAGDFADIIDENDDAATADIWFQLAVLKDVVYG